jgi:eukaryotic-like serine/threonine-protein kinase
MELAGSRNVSRTEFDLLSLDDTDQVWSILADRAERFLSAWQSGAPPDMAAHLPEEPAAIRRLTLIELIKIDLECRWQKLGELRRLDDYLIEAPELAAEIPADLIYEEYHIHGRAGRADDPKEYLARFPRQARELERLFFLRGKTDASTRLTGRRVPPGGADLAPGERIDDFDLLARLGQGAFATVYLARQNSMQRLVALKVSSDRGDEPRTLAQLDHDQIVRVYDQRVIPGRGIRLLYMQYVAGGTLQDVVQMVRKTPAAERTGGMLFAAIDAVLAARGESRPAESPLRERFARAPWAEVVCWIGARLARGLDYAHRQGVLHRDIKPANVLVAADGAPKLADFNISFSSKLDGATPAAYFGGSLAYMSPEQLEACNPADDRAPESLDGRSDLYSLGILLWELLTGARPFLDERVPAECPRALEEMTARRRAGIDRNHLTLASRHWPAGLDRVLATCLDADASGRFGTGADLARHLELCLQPKARQLMSATPGRWRIVGRRHGLAAIILLALIPNALAAIFNYYYNRVEIVEHLHNARDVFWRAQLLINSIAFPAGLFLAAHLGRRVAAVARSGPNARPNSPEVQKKLRGRCLALGHYAAGISLALWLLAAPAYPIAISFEVAQVPASVFVHFAASLALCGLIAAAYPFFSVACLSVCCLYPALVRLETMTREDQQSLMRLGRASWYYLLMAASVPMLAVAVLVLTGSQARFALGVLAAGGIFGLATAFALFRLLQADLAALAVVAAPAGELRDSTTDSFATF